MKIHLLRAGKVKLNGVVFSRAWCRQWSVNPLRTTNVQKMETCKKCVQIRKQRTK